MKLSKPLLFAGTLAFALGVQAQGMENSTGPAGANPPASSSGSGTGASAATTAPMDNKSFVTQAAQTGLAEVEMGKLAQRRASDPSVKEYAKDLVKAHSDNNKQLEKIAKSEGIKVPKNLSREDQKTRDELAQLSGPEFDQRFLQAQVTDHEKAVELFQNQAENGQGQLRTYARNTLPHLQSHLEAANQLAAQMGASSSGSAGSSAAGGQSGSDTAK